MSAMSLDELLRLLDMQDEVSEWIGEQQEGLRLTDLAQARSSDELFSSVLISALGNRLGAGLGDGWPEIAESLDRSLRQHAEGTQSLWWRQVLPRCELVFSLWGPPGVLVRYATEYRILELRDDQGAGDPLFVLLLYDERGWSGSPEVITMSSSRTAATENVAGLLATDWARQIREADPALTFRIAIPRETLWKALDEVVGPSFGDWARAFRTALDARSWIERDFLVQRARRGTLDGDPARVRATIEHILSAEPRSLDDLPSDAFEILREAYRAVWEGYEWGDDRNWAFWEAMEVTGWGPAADSGLAAVNYVRAALLPEPEWLIADERGFTWWPSAFAQRIWADPPFRDEEDELDISTVHVTTDVLTGIRDETAFWNWIARFGMVSVLGCTELDEDGTFRIHSRMELHEEIDRWGARVLHYAALTQMKEAYEFGLAFMTGTGSPPQGKLVSELSAHRHPERGARTDHAEAFTLAERGSWLVGSGEQPPPGLGPELFDTKDRWNLEFGLAPMAEAVDGGVRARVPWNGDEEAFANVDLLPSTHPRRGAGLIVHLNLPVWPDPQDAGYLNRLEGRGESGTHTLGSWGMNPGTDTLTFGTFIPGPLLERSPGMSFNLLVRNARRAAWAQGVLAERRTG